MKTLKVLLFALILTVSAPRQSPAQAKQGEKDQTIKLSTELIEVRAVVADRQGKLIDGLTKEDFEVLENGRPQAISFFSIGRVAGKGDRVSVADNEALKTGRVSSQESPARTVALFADTLHLSTISLLAMKQALRRYVDQQLSDQDLVALIPTTGTLGLAGQFTRDRRLLRYAIEKLGPGPASNDSYFTPYLAAMVDRDDQDALRVATSIVEAEDRIPPPPSYVRGRARQILSEAGYQSRATLLTLKAVAEAMAGLPGQRLIVLFSDGFTLWDGGGHINTSDVQSVVSRAVRSGVTIYSIDAKGLQPPAGFDASRPSMGSNPRIMSYISASENDLRDGLNALARDTGGEPFFNTNDLTGALQKALDNNRIYYSLAYYPSGGNEKKAFRQIGVKVKTHPDYKVRTQKGYLASDVNKEKKEEQTQTPQQRLVHAIVAPLPVTTLGLVVEADYLESEADESQVSLHVSIDGEGLEYREQDGRYVFAMDVATMVFDASGNRVDGRSETINGNLLPERLALAKRTGYRYSRRFTLKPGLYQIRVGAREVNTDRIGTGWASVEVPNLARMKLTLSSILLLDSSGDRPTSSAKAAMDPVSSRFVQGIRFYRKADFLTYYFRIYCDLAKANPEADLQMQAGIFQGEKAAAQGNWQPVSARVLGKDKKSIAAGEEIKLGNLDAGVYELRIFVKDSASKRTVRQSVVFGVDP
ncbi:MAG TPA: VWA domain-containing protein [Blastocatellia bacterium]|nr:VWA domain-containing protein [Blastocatellia bacterium]